MDFSNVQSYIKDKLDCFTFTPQTGVTLGIRADSKVGKIPAIGFGHPILMASEFMKEASVAYAMGQIKVTFILSPFGKRYKGEVILLLRPYDFSYRKGISLYVTKTVGDYLPLGSDCKFLDNGLYSVDSLIVLAEGSQIHLKVTEIVEGRTFVEDIVIKIINGIPKVYSFNRKKEI